MSRRLTIVILGLVVSGCAAPPQYQVRPVALTSMPTPIAQAVAVCEPLSRQAADQARNQVAQQQSASRNAVVGYSCNGLVNAYSAFNATTSTTCVPVTQGSGGGKWSGVAQGLNDYSNQQAAGENASRTVGQACLAQYGWRVESVCVANCR